MCIVFLSLSDNPQRDKYKVIVAANRDEMFSRPTKELNWWDDDPDIISGIDMFSGKEGGTWLGMTRSGRIGMLTNYRQHQKFKKPNEKGRGFLVSEFLKSTQSPRQFLQNVENHSSEYGGFNIILGDLGNANASFSYYCNKEQQPLTDLQPGVYALSNRYLDYCWKKVVIGKQCFSKILQSESNSPLEKVDKIFNLLSDETRYEVDEIFRNPEDEDTPDFILEGLTAIFVKLPQFSYGTRTKSVIIVDNENNVSFVEKTMIEPIEPNNAEWKTNSFKFKLNHSKSA